MHGLRHIIISFDHITIIAIANMTSIDNNNSTSPDPASPQVRRPFGPAKISNPNFAELVEEYDWGYRDLHPEGPWFPDCQVWLESYAREYAPEWLEFEFESFKLAFDKVKKGVDRDRRK